MTTPTAEQRELAARAAEALRIVGNAGDIGAINFKFDAATALALVAVAQYGLDGLAALQAALVALAYTKGETLSGEDCEFDRAKNIRLTNNALEVGRLVIEGK